MPSNFLINRKTLVFFLVGLFLIFLTGFASADMAKEEGSKMEMDAQAQAMMEKWKQFATPNENHKVLNALVGQWDHVVKWWMDPTAPPEVSKGTSDIQWIMGGRYIQHSVKGTSMGQPFEGMSIIGFDNGKKKYQLLWIDNMGTGFMNGESTFDAGKNEFHETGRFTDPMVGETKYRAVLKLIDKDHYSYEMFTNNMKGKEYRLGEIQYTRKP